MRVHYYLGVGLGVLILAGLAVISCTHSRDRAATQNENMTLVRNSNGTIMVPNQLGPYRIADPYAQSQSQSQVDLGPLPKGSVRREFNGLTYYVVPLNNQAKAR